MCSPLALDLESGDTALETIRQHGARGATVTYDQEDLSAAVSKNNVPIHPHMRPANAGGAPMGKVSGSLDNDQAEPARDPDCGSKC